MSSENKTVDFPSSSSIRALRDQRVQERRERDERESNDRREQSRRFRQTGTEIAQELLPLLALYIRENAEENDFWDLYKFQKWADSTSYVRGLTRNTVSLAFRYTVGCWKSDPMDGGIGPGFFSTARLRPLEEDARESFLSELETVLKSRGFRTERVDNEAATLRWSLG